MIRFLFRFLGLFCLALAFIFLVYDGNRSIADQMLHLTKFEEIWNALYPQHAAGSAAARWSTGSSPAGSGTR